MNCQQAESLISEYIDSTLSARATWELDKHLAECHSCTRILNETRRTVRLLADAPAFHVSDEFMTSLQARIALVEQEPPRRAWMARFATLRRPSVRPVWGAAVATCALAAIVVFNAIPHPHPAVAPQANPAARLVQSARTQGIALAASDPFGDPAAASMAASTVSNSGQASARETMGESFD
jgi:anti-sigma factor RsiW